MFWEKNVQGKEGEMVQFDPRKVGGIHIVDVFHWTLFWQLNFTLLSDVRPHNIVVGWWELS
jgi:hypothetical protein